MKIVFLCGSLAPGRDGVGDYVRQLAAGCAAAGHACHLIALHDRHLPAGEITSQPGEVRFSATLPWTMRADLLTKIVNAFAPDWVSWHLVPYGFHPKGVLPGAMRRFAQAVRRWRQHVMLHELWIGLSRSENWKARLVGTWQRHRLLAFLARLRPARLHTSNAAYQIALNRQGWHADLLPLFGNIPVHPVSRSFSKTCLAGLACGQLMPAPRCVAVLFGTIHPQWDADATLRWLTKMLAPSGRNLVLLALGRVGPHGEALLARLKKSGAIQVLQAGEIPAAHLSQLMQAADFGISTHSWALLGKSGSAIAMLEHGLPVLVPRHDWQLRGRGVVPLPHEPLVAHPTDLRAGFFLPWLTLRRAPASRRPDVCAHFCAALGEPVVRPAVLA